MIILDHLTSLCSWKYHAFFKTLNFNLNKGNNPTPYQFYIEFNFLIGLKPIGLML